ncbi:MAG: 3-deoxy-manno-octulosonate cytidylyltransferase [Chromatiaceae bacterium]|jgi:3-deoxy-manno-octulosonate cytidylyltransferase (CMP-KDO synthetase)|nr:3-deoxy-manno-octulosonate cytidylyltransferase [Chromatiaceae bacterium]
MAGFKVVIPARYGSQRLPGKPLLEIAGKPMIQHVFERACESGAHEVVIATDDARIQSAVGRFTDQVCMTSSAHNSGTDRIAEVVSQLRWPEHTLVVNLQGDEPLMPPELVSQVAATLEGHPEAGMATLAVPLTEAEQLFDANVVKVVVDRNGYALYFSRATIPWKRDLFVADAEPQPAWIEGLHRHLGIYAYRAGFLVGYARLPVSPIERMESLEQLRVLWNGGRIAVDVAASAPPAGVDTAEDLIRVTAALATR